MLADDEESIRVLVESVLVDTGHELCACEDGRSALAAIEKESPDIIILDVMMPRMNGFEVCEHLRERGVLSPILFLSAKDDIVDKGMGFKAGGDDYITKPFSPDELLMRINAHLRQCERLGEARSLVLRIGDMSFDAKRNIIEIGERSISLTPKEFQILHLMACNPGEVFTKGQLVEEVWGRDYVGEITSLAVFVRKIREKIEENPSKPKLLQTVRNIGYRFVPSGSADKSHFA